MAKPPGTDPEDLNPVEPGQKARDHQPARPAAAPKVTLDLDDAPFLDDPPEQAPTAKEPDPKPDPEPDAEPDAGTGETQPDGEKTSPKSKRNLVILGGIGAALLLAGLIFWPTRAPPPSEPEPPPSAASEQPQPKPEPKAEEITHALDPFWVNYAQEDHVAFLTLRLILVVDQPTLSLEVQRKTLILRDAVYYFLNNRPLPQIQRKEAADDLKTDLMSVMNQHLSRPLADLLIEEYLVQ